MDYKWHFVETIIKTVLNHFICEKGVYTEGGITL